MDAENLIKQATALRRLLLDRIQLVAANTVEMKRLDAAGRIYATPHWRDGKYLYLLHPGKGDGQRGAREYIGAKREAVHEALTKTWNAKNYDKLELRNQKICGLLMAIERDLERMNRELERLGPLDLATQGNGDFGDTEAPARAEIVTNTMQSDMVTGSAHQVR